MEHLHFQHLLVLYEYCKFSENFQSFFKKKKKRLCNTKLAIYLEKFRPHKARFLFLENHRIAISLAGTSGHRLTNHPPQSRADCSGPCTAEFWIFSKTDTSKPLEVTCVFAFYSKGYIQNKHKSSYKIWFSSSLKNTDQGSQCIPFPRAQFVFYILYATLKRLTWCNFGMYDHPQQFTSCPSCPAWHVISLCIQIHLLTQTSLLYLTFTLGNIFSMPEQKETH